MNLSNIARPTLLASAIALAGALSAGTALAGDQQSKTPEHLRGTITAVSDHGFSVESTRDGKTHDVTLSDDTRLAGVTPSSLDQIQEGTFIGTANAPGQDGQPSKALEVVVFPEEMKGTGEGDYPWDTPRGHDQGGSGKMGGGGSTMTNGTVSQTDSGKMGGAGGGSSMTNGTVSQADSGKMGGAGGGSTMTNGTVRQASSDQAGGDQGMMTLTVDYGDGKKQIMVPRDVPVVAVQKATMDDIKKGEAVFVGGDLSASPVQAKIVIVGLDGTVPPM